MAPMAAEKPPTPKPSTPIAATSSARSDRAAANRANPPPTTTALPARSRGSAIRVRTRGVSLSMACAPACGSNSAKTSASVPMSTAAGGLTICVVEIRICVDQLAPPTGRVRRVGSDEPIPFSGWLDLMRVLERMIGELDEGAAPGRVDR